MASSSADKALKATASAIKRSGSSSPSRRSSQNKSAPKRNSSVSSSSRKYSSRSFVDTTNTTDVPAFLFSSPPARRKSSSSVASDATQLAERRVKKRNSGGELLFTTGPPYAVRGGSRLVEKPYGKELPFERSPKSSFATPFDDLSVAFGSPVVSPPQAPALIEGVPGISSSPLLSDDEGAGSKLHDPGWSSDHERGTSPPRKFRNREHRQLEETEIEDGANRSLLPRHDDDEGKGNPVTFSNFSAPAVGEAFSSYLHENVSLMTNPLYPTISSAESSPSSFSAPHIDGFNIPAVGINLPNAPNNMSPISREEEIGPAESTAAFLQKRKAAAAAQRQKGLLIADPNSAASQAIVKRRTQVLSTVQKARTRLSVLTYEVTKKRRSFRNNWFGRIRRWLYEWHRKRLLGKGIVLNRLWMASLKDMEVSYGSSMMVAFSFIRWVFLLNAFLAVLWLSIIIIPFMAHPPKTFSWKLFWTTLRDKKAVKETFQGSNLEKTFVYYGGYTYTPAEQHGWYRVDYMYAVMIAATFLLSFICVLVRISTTIMNTGDIAVAVRLYPFSSLVFASWDFHLINTEAATKLRRSIRMQLKEMLSDVVYRYKSAAVDNRLISVKRATALFILWPLLMAANVAIVVQLVTKADQVNEAFGSNYAQALLLSLLNAVTPMIIRVLVDVEDFRPSTAERVVLMKLFCVRVLNLGALFYRLFMMLEHTLEIRENTLVIETCLDGNKCLEGFTCCTHANMTQWNICTDRDIQFCLPACTENAVGIQLLRLIVMTTLINTAYELIYGFGYVWFTSGNKRQLLIENMAIDVVYVQALVWVGSCFSPMATVVGFFANLLTWYGMRFSLFRTCGPVEKAHSATRTEVLTYGLLLLTLILSTIPATLNVMQRSSGFCGPVHERISQYTVLTTYLKRAPQGLWLTIQWLVNPAMLLGVILLLVFGVVLLQSKLVQSRQFLSLTKHELGMQRREASERLTRIRQSTAQGPNNGQNDGGGGSGPGQGPQSGRRASVPLDGQPPPGQLEAVNVPTEANVGQGQQNFLFSLANKEQEPPADDQSRSSRLQKATRTRSNQVKDQKLGPPVLSEGKYRQTLDAASRQRTSIIYSLLEKACGIWCNRRSAHRGTSRSSPDDNSVERNYFEDEVRGPIAVIRGFELPPDAKVAASAVPSIWSVLTPMVDSYICGSFSSESVSTIRTSVSFSRLAGGSGVVSTASTSYSTPSAREANSWTKSSLGFTSAVSRFFMALRGSRELELPSPEATFSEETQYAMSTPRSSVSQTSFSNMTAQAGLMPSAVSSTIGSQADSIERDSGTKATSSVPVWRRILGRSKLRSALRSAVRFSGRSGSRLLSMRCSTRNGSERVNPVAALSSIKQWLSGVVEGSSWVSCRRSLRECGTENLSNINEGGIAHNSV